jgi:uncharacterized protein YdeI (YjbR/CyaY-like superfamily)
MAYERAELTVADAAEWRAWLEENHVEPAGVWLVLARKGTSRPTRLTHVEALDEALCFGWVDGQLRSGDAATYRQRFTPRRPRSSWSQRNIGLVDRLATEGRMHLSGWAEVERARADGRWTAAYAGQATMEMPADLAAALADEPDAQATFALLTSHNRYAVLYRIGSAKRPETRARRIRQFVAMLARGETIHPQTRPPAG